MTPTSGSPIAYAGLAVAVAIAVVLLALGAAGCLCPPCPEGPTAAAGPVTPAAAAPGATNAGPATPVATGGRMVLWDGDGAGTGAKGWDACDPKAGCSKVGTAPGAGTNGSTGLKLHGEGPGFLGMGWNLFGWYPENAGYDMTPYTHLTFQIRVEAKSPEAAPDPASVGVLLGCSGNKKDSTTVALEKYAKGFGDGKWHQVAIPVALFTRGAGAQFDPRSFWEFRIATWSAGPRNFDIYVDDIALEKQ